MARLPFDAAYDGPAEVAPLTAAAGPPASWGVLLVRKGGFAVARLAGADLVEHKIGQRHVQGRTKAGGQSQQRFARRRDNQARQAYEAAAEHAARILSGVPLVVVGGDHAAIDEVLDDARLRAVAPGRSLAARPGPAACGAGRCRRRRPGRARRRRQRVIPAASTDGPSC